MQGREYPAPHLEDDDDVRDYLLQHSSSIRSGFVYVIETDQRHSPVKIGYAGDPQKRLSSLQTGNFRELRIVHVVAASMDIEQEFHFRVHQERVRGEWFAGSETQKLVRDVARFARYQAEQFAESRTITPIPSQAAAKKACRANQTPEEESARWKANVEQWQRERFKPGYAVLKSLESCPPPNQYADGGCGRKSLRQEMDEMNVEGKMPTIIRREGSKTRHIFHDKAA